MGHLISISEASTLISAEPPATVRAPEIEPGVGCNFDSYLLVPDHTLDQRIAAAKDRLGEDVVILGHHYQRDEVIKFADFRGDSLKLSFQASETYARYIVFCGVHFMAESADILRRGHQVVVLPDLNAGCSMADMADIGQVEACWNELDCGDQGIHRRATRLDLHQFQRRCRHEMGLSERRKGSLSARRASWPQHRLSHGHIP